MKITISGEFTGACARFLYLPAPGLFRKPPKWTMVAELVETSRLWTVAARIDPEWIEPVAQRPAETLIQRTTWERAQGRWMATGEVTVYGLPIVAARKVNYSQIDPARCAASCLSATRWWRGLADASRRFFRDNLRLRTEQPKSWSIKSRRRDILVDDDTLLPGFLRPAYQPRYDLHAPLR